MSQSRESAAIRRAYAAHFGCSLRTAQLHSNPDNPRHGQFVEFVKSGVSAPAKAAEPAAPSIYSFPRPDTGDPRADEVAYWRQVLKNASEQPGFEHEIPTASARLQAALRSQQQYRSTEARTGRDLGELVSRSEVRAELAEIHAQLFECYLESVMDALRVANPAASDGALYPIAKEARDNYFRQINAAGTSAAA